MNLNTNINWSKGLSLGNSSNPYSLSGFNNMKNSNTLSLSNTPQVSLNDFNTPQNSGGKSGGFDLKAGAMAAIPMVTGALGKLNDYTKRNMTDLQKTEFNAIYGKGEDPIFDLFSLGKDAKNTAQQIKNTAYTNTGVVGSNQDLLNTYNSFDFDSWKPNNNKINFLQANLKNLEASGKGASMGSSFGPWGALIGGIIGGVADIGSYIGSKKRRNLINDAKEMTKDLSLSSWKEQLNNTNKQMNLNMYRNMKPYDMGGALDYGLQNLFALNNYVNALNKSRITSMPNSFLKPQFNSMNYFAVGGMPDFNEFNTGGTHELNPNGGIPQGMDNLGVMNTVELGETKTTTPDGDYIFSDRLKLSKEECKKLGIPKNSTYAEASKILRKEYDEMPNDDIAKRGWEQSRDMLIQSLEILKQEIALKEARKQGLNSSKMQGVSDLVMQDMYYNENPQEEVLLQQGINPDIPYAFGGLVRKFARGSFLNPNTPPLNKNTYTLNNNGFTIDPNIGIVAEPTYVEDASLKKPLYRNFSGFTIKDPINYDYFEEDPRYIQEPKVVVPAFLDNSSPWFATNQSPVVNNSGSSSVFQPILTELNWPTNTNNIVTPAGTVDVLDKINKDVSLIKAAIAERKALEQNTQKPKTGVETKSTTTTTTDNTNDNSKTIDLEKLRYAPAIGSGLSLLNNLFTREDNSLANNYRNLAKLVNTYIPNNNNYNYLIYNPVDINALLNRQAAQQAAYRNAMRNSSNPNVNSSLLAQAYNDAIANGDLVNRLNAANRDLYNSVITGNNSITQQRNADNLNIWNAVQNAETLKRNYLQLAAEAENAERAKRDTAISQSANNFVTNLANIGNQAAYDKQFNIWQAGQTIPTNLAMRVAAGLLKEQEAYDELKKQNYSKEAADNYMKLMFGPKFNPATVKWK